jgi:hypothetical protein
MRLYAKPSLLLTKQILADVGIVLWVMVWIWAAQQVKWLVEQLAAPAHQTLTTARDLSSGLGTAAANVAELPVVGEGLRAPFDEMSTQLDTVAASAKQTIEQVNLAAMILAVVVFAIPVAYYLFKWLPFRVGFMAQSRHAVKLLRGPHAMEFFALRALANAPLGELRKISADPMKGWLDNDAAVIRKLAAVELGADGIGLGKIRQESGAWTTLDGPPPPPPSTQSSPGQSFATWDNLRSQVGEKQWKR